MEFSKLQGTGNDFVVIDNRDGNFERFIGEIPIERVVRVICSRKTGVGADGLILVEDSKIADFKWRFFNSDGSTAEMCGNGARCVSRFAFEKGIVGKKMTFETLAGIIEAEVDGESVKVKLTKPYDLKLDLEVEGVKGHFINTGVPHFVSFVEDLENVDVKLLGRKIRFSSFFSPGGTNVNFAKVENGKVFVRTYERGVENETLACGTGSVACALIASKKFNLRSPIEVIVRSGESLKIYFDENLENVFLEGKVVWVFGGVLKREIFHE
jgi:diaminopimelate epimerase